MAFVKYHRYIGELWQDLDLEDLVGELSDFFLQSGFGQEVDEWNEDNLQALHDAILDALLRRGLLSEEQMRQLMGEQDTLDEFLQKVVERMVREGYLRSSEAQPFHDPTGSGGGEGPEGKPVKFELTEKAVDFLGFRALRDLLGSVGKASFGRHDTRELATGVEASGPSKEWEFGDTMNLDVSGTLLNAIAREGMQRAPRRRLRGPAGPPVGVPVVVRDGRDARLLAQHDPLWRGPLHAGQARGPRPLAPAAHAVPGRHRCTSCSSTTPPRRCRSRSSRRSAWARTTRTPARACASRSGSWRASART